MKMLRRHPMCDQRPLENGVCLNGIQIMTAISLVAIQNAEFIIKLLLLNGLI